MKRLYRKSRKVLAVILAVGLVISMTSCGQKEAESIDEYGGKEVSPTAASDTDDNGFDVSDAVTSNGKTLREFFGQFIYWDDLFTYQNKEIKVHIASEIPDEDGLGVYSINNTVDDSQEAALLDRLFDDEPEKIEELGYTNETDYIMHLYRLRRLTGELSGNFSYSYKVIDSSFEDKFQWTDNANYSIHMYKGKYQGIDYGLILAYDYFAGVRYITFLPVSIKDYYPEFNFKTLMIEGTEDVMGNTFDIKNKCPLSPDGVKDQALEFMESELGITGYTCKVSNNHEGYVTNMSEMTPSLYYGIPNTDCISMLRFSDSDYISTDKAAQDSSSLRHNFILAEQEDIAAEYAADHQGTDEIQAVWLAAESDRVNEDVELYTDGYAVYLENPFQIDYDVDDLFINIEGGQILMSQTVGCDNLGCIMVTSKGLFGADIRLGADVYDVTDNVELLSFEKMKEALKNALENEVDLRKIAADKIDIPQVLLNYAMVVDEDDSSLISMVPVWEFRLVYGERVDNIQINAMDGSVVDASLFEG
ncbi:MAG: hypothetical protein J5517_10980 [Eubacterium sp.]|nr:hypothetical protein [Eubacterium sp.]